MCVCERERVRSVRGSGYERQWWASGNLHISHGALGRELRDDRLHMHEAPVYVCVMGVFFPAAAHTHTKDGVIGCTCHSHSICCSDLHTATGLPKTQVRSFETKYGEIWNRKWWRTHIDINRRQADWLTFWSPGWGCCGKYWGPTRAKKDPTLESRERDKWWERKKEKDNLSLHGLIDVVYNKNKSE